MADYKIKLGTILDTSGISKSLKSLDNTYRIRVDIDNSRLLKQINHAKSELAKLNNLGINKNIVQQPINNDSKLNHNAKNKLETEIADTTNKVVQGAQKQVEALNSISAANKNLNNNGNNRFSRSVQRDFEKVKVAFDGFKGDINGFKNVLKTLDGVGISFDTSAIDSATQHIREIGNVTAKINGKQISLNVKGTDDAGRAVDTVIRLNKVTEETSSSIKLSQNFTTIADRARNVSTALKSIEKGLNDISTKSSKGGNLNQLDEWYSSLNVLKTKYEELKASLREPINKGVQDEIQSELDQTEQKIKETEIAYENSKKVFAQKVASNFGTEIRNEMSKAKNAYDSIRQPTENLVNLMKTLDSIHIDMGNLIDEDGAVKDVNELIQLNKQYLEVLKKVKTETAFNKRVQNKSDSSAQLQDKKELFKTRVSQWEHENSAALKKFGGELSKIKSQINKVDSMGLKHLESEFTKLGLKAKETGLNTQTLGQQLKNQFSRYTSYLSIATAFMYTTMAMRDMFRQVLAVDKAMTELKKVTDESQSTYNNFLENASKRATELGTTVDGLVSSTADFARLGYSFSDAKGLAEVANIYAVVGDEIEGIDEATKSLISTMAAFKESTNAISNEDFAMGIVDKFNEVSNNFAISSGGIGVAMERSASSLKAANNTIDESIALITAANTVVQDPAIVGTAFKTISMRIRGARTELEEAGLETDGMVKSVSKLREEIMALSGVDIMENEDTFKSTYQIMDELSRKWKELTDIQQATITELIAGKRQGNIVSSMMNNFETARDALKTSEESAGSALREHEKWSESLDAKLKKLKASWQSLAQSFMSSKFLKNTIDLLRNIVKIIDTLIKNLGVLGTVGLAFGINGIIRNFNNLSSLPAIVMRLPAIVMRIGNAFSKAHKYGKDFSGSLTATGKAANRAGLSLSAVTGAIGILTAVFGFAYSQIKKAREEEARLRQETIDSSNTFLDASLGFEKAYIKYSGKNNLTEEEEAELTSAIDATTDALKGKSNALKDVANNTSDYAKSLEKIKDAELKAAAEAAKDKQIAAEKELKETTKGFANFESEINVTVGLENSTEGDLAKKIGKKYFAERGHNSGGELIGFKINADASTDEIIQYYHMLLKYKEALIEAGAEETKAFDETEKTISKLAKTIDDYTSGLYQNLKAQYQRREDVPKTTEDYLKMREFILSEMKNAGFEQKNSVASMLDDEYSKIFDLSTPEAISDKFLNVIDNKKYNQNDKNTVKRFLELQTKVNGNDATIGEYVDAYDKALKVADDFSPDESSTFKNSLGFDKDEIIEMRKDIIKESANNKQNEIKKFLNGLNKNELKAVYNLKTEIDWENSSTEQVYNQIKKEADMIGKISFDIDLNGEIENLEKLKTSISESVSPTGLKNESIENIKSMFKFLPGYNEVKLFERTANGIRLNKKELSKLSNEYKNTNINELNNKLGALGDAYNKTKSELYGLTYGSEEYLEKSRELANYTDDINKIEESIALYKGLTSAYQEWQNAEASGNERDMYEGIIKGFESIEDELSRGWADDGTIEFLELLTGQSNLASKSGKELKDIYDSLGNSIENTSYSIKDFFTVDENGNSTNQGVYNFLEAINELKNTKFNGKDVIEKDGNTIVGFDFKVVGGDKAIAEALGISEELVQIMVRAADDAGFVISMDGTYQQLKILREKAQLSAEKINEIFSKHGIQEIGFNFNAEKPEELKKDLDKATSLLSEFKNKDGTLNMDIEGAEDMYNVASTLQTLYDKASEPVYMRIDVGQVEKELKTPLTKLQEYERLTQQENQLKLKGTDTTELEKSKSEVLKYFDELNPNIKAKLGIKGLDEEEIKKKLDSGELKIPATVDIQLEMDDKLGILVDKALLDAGIIDNDEFKKRVDVYLEPEITIPESKDTIDSKIDEALKDTKLSEEHKTNIKAFAQVFGISDLDELKNKLATLDDKEINILTKIPGGEKLKKLQESLGKIDDKTLEVIVNAIGEGDVESLSKAIKDIPDEKVAKAIAEAFGYSSVEELCKAIEGMDSKTVQAIADTFGIKNVDDLRAAVSRLSDKEVDAVVNTSGQKKKVDSLQDAINGLKGRTVYIWASIKKAASNLWDKITGNNKENKAGADGTAFADGTVGKSGKAFKQGNWGTKDSGVALGGEEAPELLVRNGKWHLIGEKGAEFFGYKKNDIIFNATQTKQILENGKITRGKRRGKALIGGTAFHEGSEGTGGLPPSYGTSASNHYNNNKSNKNSKSSSSSNEKDSKSKEFKEDINWIEIAINRIERAIDSLGLKAKSVYKTWASRNSALAQQLSKVGEEINIQESAYNRYLQAANSVGLSSSFAEKVRNGKIDIEKITDENLKNKINEYKNFYEKALDCKKAIEDLKEKEAELIKQRFENASKQYDGILGVIEHEKNMIDENINQSESKSWLVSGEYYKALEENERKNITQLEKKKRDMIEELNNAIASGKIKKGSEAWYEMVNAIDEVTLSISKSQTELMSYQQTLQQLNWKVFDLMQDKISSVAEESSFLIDLMSNEKLHDDKGKLTDQGMATMGLHGQNYNTHMAQADLARKEAEKLKKELEKDPFDTELEARYREMIKLQQEHIMNAEGEKNAIKDLVEQGIELELDSLQKLIDEYNKALDSQKNLYDYQKRVEEQTKNIASLQKQLSAYQGDTSEEAQSKIQELKVSLKDAENQLKETEYEKWISDQKIMLDELYLSYEETLNTRLDNIDALISDMILEINSNASNISSTIATETQNVGYTLSDSMRTIWGENSSSINNVITNYGDKFLNANTTTNNALNNINVDIKTMINQLNKIAESKIKEANNSSVSKPQNTQSNKPKPQSTQPSKPKPVATPPKTIKTGGKINAKGAYIYDYKGDTSGERQYYGADPIYKVLKADGNWLQVRYHRLSSGITGWFKKGDVKAYKTGKKDINDNHVAWTQENGKEFIVRPSDGAILTPVAKGDSVLNAKASNNIWDMANSPTEFIKENLGLGSVSAPNNSNTHNNYTQNLDNVVFNFPNVKNYNELLSTMQKDKNFEKLILSMSIDRIAGKSSLAKNKIIRK